jgi:futalosine hydrolase
MRNLLMQILVVASTEMEIAPFLAQFPSAQYLITGVGIPATCYQLTKRLHQFDYDMLIQAGIAGAFFNGPALGEVVLVSDDCFADLGIGENGNWFNLFEKGLSDPDSIPFSNGWLSNTELNINSYGYPLVKAATVNRISDDPLWIKSLSEKYEVAIETMEGAAFHYVCLIERIPFLQIRAVSNWVGERDKRKWAMEPAINNLNIALKELYSKYQALA